MMLRFGGRKYTLGIHQQIPRVRVAFQGVNAGKFSLDFENNVSEERRSVILVINVKYVSMMVLKFRSDKALQ